jgi:hypothetical protein
MSPSACRYAVGCSWLDTWMFCSYSSLETWNPGSFFFFLISFCKSFYVLVRFFLVRKKGKNVMKVYEKRVDD